MKPTTSIARIEQTLRAYVSSIEARCAQAEVLLQEERHARQDIEARLDAMAADITHMLDQRVAPPPPPPVLDESPPPQPSASIDASRTQPRRPIELSGDDDDAEAPPPTKRRRVQPPPPPPTAAAIECAWMRRVRELDEREGVTKRQDLAAQHWPCNTGDITLCSTPNGSHSLYVCREHRCPGNRRGYRAERCTLYARMSPTHIAAKRRGACSGCTDKQRKDVPLQWRHMDDAAQ